MGEARTANRIARNMRPLRRSALRPHGSDTMQAFELLRDPNSTFSLWLRTTHLCRLPKLAQDAVVGCIRPFNDRLVPLVTSWSRSAAGNHRLRLQWHGQPFLAFFIRSVVPPLLSPCFAQYVRLPGGLTGGFCSPLCHCFSFAPHLS